MRVGLGVSTTASAVRADPPAHRRLLAAGPMDLPAHLARHGPLPRVGAELIAAVEAAGLHGRGGAGFPTHRKLAAVAGAARGKAPVVIANGAEGEPASAKDRTLLACSPHLVLDGLQLAAAAVGARRAHIYLPEAAAAPISKAVAQRRGVDRVEVAVHAAPDTFISGEESAVVAAVSGRPALPRDKLLRITEAGVDGAPTLVQNVETLAHLALIARYGPSWFRLQGTPHEPGTFLATVSGPVAAPGVYEVPYGIALGDLFAAAGDLTAPVAAVLVGGFHGGWVPANADLPLSRAGLAGHGASPGAGVVLPLPAHLCGLVETAHLAGYLAGQTAGQCGPCVNGLPRLAETLDALARRSGDPRLPVEVRRLAALVTGRGACRHPDGTARLINSAMRVFAPDVSAHLAGRCLADQYRRYAH
ncbi:MAG: hypothetical protein QOE61_640 [Micromonosporaceae bacterium]|nr:hypothetical protein [Micromonosporaceae bacterium]